MEPISPISTIFLSEVIEKECALCKEEYTNESACSLPVCGHFFHKGCMDEMIANTLSNCPLCHRSFYHLSPIELWNESKSIGIKTLKKNIEEAQYVAILNTFVLGMSILLEMSPSWMTEINHSELFDLEKPRSADGISPLYLGCASAMGLAAVGGYAILDAYKKAMEVYQTPSMQGILPSTIQAVTYEEIAQEIERRKQGKAHNR